uniref:Uncharacterized protein n=1 Tax=Fagus sylvatica TaxID=28930 RepID=A0A2N9EUV2_FAGSY
MAPGSRGAGAIFVCFSGEDSGQTGKATGEPRVPRRGWSFHLSNAPRLADQLVFAGTVDLAPSIGFRRSWYRWKAYVTFFLTVLDLRRIELGLTRYGSANQGHRGVFGPSEDVFPIETPALHGGELGFTRYDLANRGYRNVPYVNGSLSDRDSGLTGGALDDPEVAHRS